MSKHGPTNTSATECTHGVSLKKPCIDCDLSMEAYGNKRQAQRAIDARGLAATHTPRHRAPGIYQIGRKQRGEMDL
jgi:hypothetical protein